MGCSPVACLQPEDCGLVASLKEVDGMVGWVVVPSGCLPLCRLSVAEQGLCLLVRRCAWWLECLATKSIVLRLKTSLSRRLIFWSESIVL